MEEDVSLPLTEIARNLKLNESTIIKRVVNLQKKGIIKKFTIVIDPSKIGYNTVSIISIDVDPSKLLEVAQKLCEIKEARYVATSTGDHMIMVEIWTRD